MNAIIYTDNCRRDSSGNIIGAEWPWTNWEDLRGKPIDNPYWEIYRDWINNPYKEVEPYTYKQPVITTNFINPLYVWTKKDDRYYELVLDVPGYTKDQINIKIDEEKLLDQKCLTIIAEKESTNKTFNINIPKDANGLIEASLDLGQLTLRTNVKKAETQIEWV